MCVASSRYGRSPRSRTDTRQRSKGELRRETRKGDASVSGPGGRWSVRDRTATIALIFRENMYACKK